MKKALLLLLALVLLAVAAFILTRGPRTQTAAPAVQPAAPPPPKIIARVYFTGADNLAADTNSLAFTNIFCCSQARALESQTLDKLSRAPGTWFKGKLPSGVEDGSAPLRPLLDDFLKSEWVFEMREAEKAASPEYALAIRLNNDRARLWQANLRTLLESWTGIKARDITNGWQLKKDMPPNLFRIVRAGDWLVIGCGQDDVPLADDWASGEGLPGRQANWIGPSVGKDLSWVSANFDWPRLARIFPKFSRFDLPDMDLHVVGRNGLILSRGTFELSHPLPRLDPWRFPTNIVHEPLTSFTALRGFAPWLERQPWAKWLRLSPEPDQAFLWSTALSPLQTFVAVPVTNGATALAQLGDNFAADTKWEKHLIAPFRLSRATNRIFLADVPFAAPEVRTLTEPSGDFLFADIFPNSVRGKAPPQALMDAIDHDNLVFYHWEITSQRLKELPELTQLALLLTRHRQLNPNLPASGWLTQIGPELGNCVTEITQTGPLELAFKRSGSVGMTAVELIALADWLDAPNFPGFDMSLPPRHRPLHHELTGPHASMSVDLPAVSHPPFVTKPPIAVHPPTVTHPVH